MIKGSRFLRELFCDQVFTKKVDSDRKLGIGGWDGSKPRSNRQEEDGLNPSTEAKNEASLLLAPWERLQKVGWVAQDTPTPNTSTEAQKIIHTRPHIFFNSVSSDVSNSL